MARGNGIIVSANPQGKFTEGILGAGLTVYPGTVVQRQAATAEVGGRYTYEVYNADADGGRPKGPFFIVLENALLGKAATASYAAGERIFLYTPLPGDELNLMIGDVAGTGDDHTKGEMLIVDDTTGEFVATTGSPETEVAQLLETLTDPTADQLAHCQWTGY